MWTVSHSPQLSVYTTTRRLTNRASLTKRSYCVEVREFPPEPAPASNAYGFHTFNHYDLQPFFQARQRTGCVDFQIATGNRTRLEKGGVSWLAMDVAQLRRGNLFLAAFLTVFTCANWHGHDL
ncbi:hypothetical protein T4D_9193 [Trichinella pseudospiralis]|uniref:Uncharacterized protein n=1 Tax=Trichinella pseudospiralis TaxID=6337 RepID=A0A0V1FF71_TRIPS|nr:hypothetical protein T4D_9193 [Trichinella pseudospiralis]